ncbi:MAG: hypothetical protein ACXVC5_08670, partial [Tumebacillaceae bacterium]
KMMHCNMAGDRSYVGRPMKQRHAEDEKTPVATGQQASLTYVVSQNDFLHAVRCKELVIN